MVQGTKPKLRGADKENIISDLDERVFTQSALLLDSKKTFLHEKSGASWKSNSTKYYLCKMGFNLLNKMERKSVCYLK